MPDPYLDKDLSGLSDETLIRDLIISRTIIDDLVTASVIEDDLGHARAIIRELMARGWTNDEIIEQTNAPWIEETLQLVDEAAQRGKAKKPRR